MGHTPNQARPQVPAPPSGRRLVELDAIRGIAALAIVFFHFGTGYQWGSEHPYRYFKYFEEFVQVFFVLSGFVILISFTRIKRSLDFIVGRFARLYPVYWLSVLVTILAVYLLNVGPVRTEDPWAILMNFSMVQQLVRLPNINIVYWTLTLELVFYGIFILLYKLKLLGKVEFILGAWMTVIFLDTLKAMIALNSTASPESAEMLVATLPHISDTAQTLIAAAGDPAPSPGILSILKDHLKSNVLLMQGRALLFIAGVLLYRGWTIRFTPLRIFMILACIGIKALDYSPDTPWYSSIFFAVFVGLTYLAVTEKLRFLAVQPFIILGQISYALYLLHIQVGWITQGWFQAIAIPPEISILIQVALAIALSFGVTKTLEGPAMKRIKGWYKQRTARA